MQMAVQEPRQTAEVFKAVKHLQLQVIRLPALDMHSLVGIQLQLALAERLIQKTHQTLCRFPEAQLFCMQSGPQLH